MLQKYIISIQDDLPVKTYIVYSKDYNHVDYVARQLAFSSKYVILVGNRNSCIF